MPDFDIGGTASSVFGIAGMGIGLGLLAHTANNITRMSDQMYDRPRRRRDYGYGLKDGSQRGRRSGGRRRNRTSTCRHPRRRSTSRRPSMYNNYWW